MTMAMKGSNSRTGDLLWCSLLMLILVTFGILTIDSQPKLSFDDHGKDLYAFEMFLKGGWPCRDYWWQYGPLMLFYYAFWLLVGGINLISIRLGVACLYIVSSFFVYRALRRFISAPVAFMAALAFMIQWLVYPYYNFNHLGAVPPSHGRHLRTVELFCDTQDLLGLCRDFGVCRYGARQN